MCKIQIIHRINDIVTTDTILELPTLKKLSINNIPYYLTVSYSCGILKYELKYLDSPDCVKKSINDFQIEYGESTGRLYSFETKSDENRLSNKRWEDIKKIVSAYNLPEQNELLLFIKVLQENDTHD